jgi:hypothetical protein
MESPRGGGGKKSKDKDEKKPIFEMDTKCMSCSGQLAGGLLQCFKLACLAYYPTNIVFRSKLS